MARKPQARSEQTRARILDTARSQFAAEGYERTTIRSVAAEAEIDPSLVMRYFGSKDGLFAAAAPFDLRLPDLRLVPPDRRGRHLAEHFLKVWGTTGKGANPAAILLRTAATNEAAAARMKEIFRKQVRPAIEAVVADDAGSRAALISAHIFGFAYCRFVIGLPEMTAMAPTQLLDHLAAAIQRCLDA
jgi:AcrR family transcriptional regulator